MIIIAFTTAFYEYYDRKENPTPLTLLIQHLLFSLCLLLLASIMGFKFAYLSGNSNKHNEIIFFQVHSGLFESLHFFETFV